MILLLALAFRMTRDNPMTTPVILSTDFGVDVDDQWALTHLALSPEVELRAVVTSHAPGLKPSDAATAVRRWIDGLRLANKPEVEAGSALPLKDKETARENEAVQLILRESKKETGGRRVVVFVIGAATDMASALLKDASLADRVNVVAMGFSKWPEGGDPWNVKNDVKAWQVLLDSRVPLVVGDEAVCKRYLGMTTETAFKRFNDAGGRGKVLVGLLEARLKKYHAQAEKTTGSPDTWPVWDEVTVAHLLGLTEVEVRPRPRLRDDMSFDHSDPSRGTIGWIRSVKSDALWDDFGKKLAGVR